MKHITFFLKIALFALLASLIGCKGKDGEPGPQGQQGDPIGTTIWDKKEGFVKSTVYGTMNDGTNFKWNMDFQGVQKSSNSYFNATNHISDESDKKRIEISRLYSGEGEKFKFGQLKIAFTVNSLDDLSAATIVDFTFYTEKDLGNGSVYSVNRSYYGAPPSSLTRSSVSDLKYNKTTGVLEGKSIASFEAKEDEGSINFYESSFSVKLIQTISRID